MKTILLWTLALLMLAAPGAAEAVTPVVITVSIQATRGTTTVTVNANSTNKPVPFTDGAGKPAMALACTSNVAGVTNSTAGTATCSRVISIGGTTVTIRDISTTNRARVYLTDGLSSDILNLAGVLATSGTGISATSGVTLKISYSSSSYTPLVYNLYAYTAAMSGNFFNASGGTPSACTTTTPCLTLKLTANNVTVNQFGDNAIATVNVPPIGTGGAFGPATLNPSETKSIPCGTSGSTALTCTPSLQGELTAIYKGSSETLKVVGGAAVGGSNNPITSGGVIDTTVDVSAPEYISPPVDPFVDYTQEATLHANLQQDGASFRNISNSSKVPLAWNIEKVTGFNQTDSTQLRSIVTNSPIDNNTDLFNKGAYVAFVPTRGQAQVRDLTSIIASYEWKSGDCSTQVGVLPPAPSSWFVELQLETLQRIRIFLGGSTDFLTQCATNAFSDVNLVGFNGKNVQLPDGSFVGYNTMRGQFGSVGLRAISVFLTQTNSNQVVDLTSFTIGAFNTTFARVGGRTPIFAATCDFPGVNEFMMRFSQVDANHVPIANAPGFLYGDEASETFVVNGCQLRSQVPVTSFPPQSGGLASGFWKIELLFNLVPVGEGFIKLL